MIDKKDETVSIPPMGLGLSFLIFGGATVLILVCTRLVIPYLSELSGLEPIFFWFVVAGAGVFAPLLITAWWMLQQENSLHVSDLWQKRLRFRRMSQRDWLWALGSLVVIGILSGGLIAAIRVVFGQMDHQPSFMTFEPLTPGRYGLLAFWFPYWLLNIMGEEILWRGVILPRQEAAFGGSAWVVNAFGWLLFHVAFGWQLFITLLPIVFILPYVVQRLKNTWVGVAIHAGLNGPSFLAIAFGWI
jgi:membrane protease YdiL (CAAX protease family)